LNIYFIDRDVNKNSLESLAARARYDRNYLLGLTAGVRSSSIEFPVSRYVAFVLAHEEAAYAHVSPTKCLDQKGHEVVCDEGRR